MRSYLTVDHENQEQSNYIIYIRDVRQGRGQILAATSTSVEQSECLKPGSLSQQGGHLPPNRSAQVSPGTRASRIVRHGSIPLAIPSSAIVLLAILCSFVTQVDASTLDTLWNNPCSIRAYALHLLDDWGLGLCSRHQKPITYWPLQSNLSIPQIPSPFLSSLLPMISGSKADLAC